MEAPHERFHLDISRKALGCGIETCKCSAVAPNAGAVGVARYDAPESRDETQNEDINSLLSEAHRLAQTRGYFELPTPIVLAQAERLAGQYHAAFRHALKVAIAISRTPFKDGSRGRIAGHIDAASAIQKNVFVDYMASLAPLGDEARRTFLRATNRKYAAPDT